MERITIILPVSRETYLQRLFKNLNELILPCEVSILTYIDGNMKLYEKARNLTQTSKFEQKLAIWRKCGSIPTSVHLRRQRIADIHNEIKKIVNDCDYVFLLEDDTLVPEYTLVRLLEEFNEFPDAGFISGLEIGRWGYEHIGAWNYDNNIITSILMPDQKVKRVEVDASGFYCCLAKKEVYCSHKFKPFLNVLGPDFEFGITIGRKNFVCPDILCIHMTQKKDITFENSDVIQVEITHEGAVKNV